MPSSKSYEVIYKGMDQYGNQVFEDGEGKTIHLSPNALSKYWSIQFTELVLEAKGTITSMYPDWFKEQFKCKWKDPNAAAVVKPETEVFGIGEERKKLPPATPIVNTTSCVNFTESIEPIHVGVKFSDYTPTKRLVILLKEIIDKCVAGISIVQELEKK